MSIYTIGGADEPSDRKLNREMRLYTLSTSIPKDVLEAARVFLGTGNNSKYESELKRILGDEQMESFWCKLKVKFKQSKRLPSGEIAKQKLWLSLISSCIKLMATKGGILPEMSGGKFKDARKDIARDIKKLKKTLERPSPAYKNVAKLSLFDMAKLCTKSQDERIAEDGDFLLSKLLQETYIPITHKLPNLQNILAALLEQIEAGKPLSLKDKVLPTHNVPQLNRPQAQQKFFQENLLDTLYIYIQIQCWALTATAINVVFDLPEGEVTGTSLRENSKKKNK